jgi:hypothetical protein
MVKGIAAILVTIAGSAWALTLLNPDTTDTAAKGNPGRGTITVPKAASPAGEAAAVEADGESDALLSGPKVAATAAAPTLIERDLQGKIRRLETTAEEAALALLDLDAVTKEKVNKILAMRTAALDSVVVNNVPLLLKFQAARETGDRRDLAELTGELTKAAAPLREQGRLKENIAAVLPNGERERFESLVSEYWKAILAERRELMAKEQGSGGTGLRTAGRAAATEFALAVGQEIKRSYERTLGQRIADFENLLKSLSLDMNTETKVRNMVTDHAQKYIAQKGGATPAQNRELFFKIMNALTLEQRADLIRELRERGMTESR